MLWKVLKRPLEALKKVGDVFWDEAEMTQIKRRRGKKSYAKKLGLIERQKSI